MLLLQAAFFAVKATDMLKKSFFWLLKPPGRLGPAGKSGAN